ncbi:YdaS family helix-turn-helix protein [Citrobacter sp. 70972423]|uniref:YdaS family helix-turn-helix protein n=1 Tax=Citrobacter sp. 70972423 TaxID=3118148 RepID=UPI003754F571
MSSQNLTEKAVKAAGKSLSEVARRFGFKSTQSVANWVINNQVPSERVLQLCELGCWSVTPHELRPDILQLIQNFRDCWDAVPQMPLRIICARWREKELSP